LRVVGKAVMGFLSFGHGQSPETKNSDLLWIVTLSFRLVDTTNGTHRLQTRKKVTGSHLEPNSYHWCRTHAGG
jgi:hypothetical protein